MIPTNRCWDSEWQQRAAGSAIVGIGGNPRLRSRLDHQPSGQEMLGLEDREELFAFFKANNVLSKFTLEDLEKGQATAAAIFGQ